MNLNTETKEKIESKKYASTSYSLVLYNDDVNTFETVINAIIKICKHSTIQAEQCTWIVHFNGKCVVKKDEGTKLVPLCSAFIDRGINASIE